MPSARCIAELSGQMAAAVADVLQVIFTTGCELVTPKHVVPGTLKILQGQLHFTGDPVPEDGSSGTAPESPAPRAKVSFVT